MEVALSTAARSMSMLGPVADSGIWAPLLHRINHPTPAGRQNLRGHTPRSQFKLNSRPLVSAGASLERPNPRKFRGELGRHNAGRAQLKTLKAAIRVREREVNGSASRLFILPKHFRALEVHLERSGRQRHGPRGLVQPYTAGGEFGPKGFISLCGAGPE